MDTFSDLWPQRKNCGTRREDDHNVYVPYPETTAFERCGSALGGGGPWSTLSLQGIVEFVQFLVSSFMKWHRCFVAYKLCRSHTLMRLETFVCSSVIPISKFSLMEAGCATQLIHSCINVLSLKLVEFFPVSLTLGFCRVRGGLNLLSDHTQHEFCYPFSVVVRIYWAPACAENCLLNSTV